MKLSEGVGKITHLDQAGLPDVWVVIDRDEAVDRLGAGDPTLVRYSDVDEGWYYVAGPDTRTTPAWDMCVMHPVRILFDGDSDRYTFYRPE